VPTAGNQKDTVYLSHFPVQVLSAEQLYDSLTAVLGPPPGRERGRQNVPPQLRGQNNPKALFVFFFQGDEVFDPTKYEAGIPQVLRLMNGPRFQAGLNRKAAEGRGKLKPEEVVEHLYLSTLSRRPTPAENARLMKYVASERDQTAAYGDVLWAILNSSEFTMNH
jgi:hypothetical protein